MCVKEESKIDFWQNFSKNFIGGIINTRGDIFMKKSLKIVLITIGILVGLVLLDTIQALVFNNNPIIGTEMWCKKKSGIIVDTYHCNGKNITKFKDSSCNTESVCVIDLESLENIHEIIDNRLVEYEQVNGKKYSNVASTGVDREKNKLIIELIDNSKEQQKWFRENIYDSEYIVFKKGGPYHAY